ncbi:MAG: hypothetical protein R6U26_00935 [Candidatus Undinarchaeales archaeon]
MNITKSRVSELWKLSREKYPDKYSLSEKSNNLLKEEKIPISVPTLHFKSENISAYQSHSQRSAWLHKPWKSKKVWYPGIEYKGIGDNGNKIRSLGKTAWGGLELEKTTLEHKFSRKAFNAGIFCQRPIACYEYGEFKGKKLAVLVRTFVSPLRLSDFHFDEEFLSKYLDFREQTEEEYVNSLAEILGKNVRKLFDIGLIHGSLEMNNITTEGELADFEPTSGGTWEGVMENKEPKFRVLTLTRLFSAINDIFTETDTFLNTFTEMFFNKNISLSSNFPEKEIVEKYIGKELTEEDLKIKFPEFKNIEKAKKILKKARKKTTSEKEKKRLDFILKELG